MFQLILGISLGVILLFVILLLITEVAATYPLWKHLDKKPLSQKTIEADEKIGRPRRFNYLILFIGCFLGCCIGLLLINSDALLYKKNSLRLQAQGSPIKPTTNHLKSLTDSSADRTLSFLLKTKWENGVVHGNNRVVFHKDSVRTFNEWRYYLLDKEGFLVKEVILAPQNFVYETNSTGQIRGLSNKFTVALSLGEYQKIEKLQVVLDKKLRVE